MAIIYSYPLVTSIQPSDLLILSVDSSELPTRQVTVGDLLASGAVDVNLNFTADTGTGSVNLSTQSLEVRQGVYVTTTATNQELIINHKSTVRQDTANGDTSPGYGGSFTVIDSVVTDATGSGHVTGVNLKTVTLPAADDTNTTYELLGYNTGIELVGSDNTRDQIQIIGGGGTTVSQANNIITVSSTSDVTGTGTTDTLTKWTGPTTLGDSIVSESGTTLTIAGDINSQGAIEGESLTINTGPSTLTGNVTFESPVTFEDDVSIGGTVDMNSGTIENLADPTAAQEAATKAYVDATVTGLLKFKGTFKADSGLILSGTNNGLYLYNCPGGAGTRVAVDIGDYYIVTNTGGQFYCSGDLLQVGDSVVAVADAPADASNINNWGILEGDNIEGSGTANKLPIWTDSQVLADSLITQTRVDGGTIFDLNAVTGGNYTPAINTKLLDLNSGGAKKFSITQDGGGGVVLPNSGGVTNPGPSFNMGGGAFSNGKSGVAMGTTTTAFGNGSLAANFLTLASGGGASAFGLLTEAAGLASVAFGNKSVASGNYSIASGQDTIASGQSAVAIGEKGDAQGKNTFVSGFSGTATGNNAVKFGYEGSASGNNSAKFGFESVASGANSLATGTGTTASGLQSIATGDNNVVSANNSFIGGKNSTVTAESSILYGQGSSVGSVTSAAFGQSNTITTSSLSSFVAGDGNNTNSNGQVKLIGSNLIASTQFGVYLGRNNDNTDLYNRFQIGNGIAGNSRSNALSINNAGYVKLPTYGSGNVSGTATRNLSVAADGQIIETANPSTPDYLSFVCLLSQSGTANPQPNLILENSLGIPTPFTAFTRVSAGVYNLNATGKFKSLKTIMLAASGSGPSGTSGNVGFSFVDADNLRILTSGADNFTKIGIEIRTYN